MRATSNSADYWEKIIRNNKTIKTKMFIDEPITEKTVYIHYVIFNKKSGIESVWTPIPKARMLLGFIQYCFLPEAYYRWIEGKENKITNIPSLSVENVLSMGIKNEKLDKIEIQHMRSQINSIKKMWNMPSSDLIKNIKKFSREFNRAWLGNSTEFLYLNVYNNAEELGQFVLSTNEQTDYKKDFEEKIGLSAEQWLELCKNAHKDKEAEAIFKSILFKQLTEVI